MDTMAVVMDTVADDEAADNTVEAADIAVTTEVVAVITEMNAVMATEINNIKMKFGGNSAQHISTHI